MSPGVDVSAEPPVLGAEAVVPAPTPITPAAGPPTPLPVRPLQEVLEEVVSRHPGAIGVVVKHLGTGETASINAEQRFRSASLYKLFVLAAAQAAMEQGELDPNEVLTLSPALARSNPYADLPAGARLGVDCAMRTMIEMSGNAAADLVERRLGLPAINAHMAALGLRLSEVRPDVAYTSPADMAQLLELIARGDAVSPSASARMLDLLGAQQHADLQPAPLPLGVHVAHKTGQLPGLRHDAGIVYAPSGPYVFAALVQEAPSEAAARAAIVELSRAAYTTLEAAEPPPYRGLPPRLARHVLQVPDAQGRLALLLDPLTETAPLGPAGVALADGAEEPRLRPEAIPDLLALQEAAGAASVPFWVSGGYQKPGDVDASKAVPVTWVQPCQVALPPTTERALTDEEVDEPPPPPLARQRWLGTVVVVADQADGEPSQARDTATVAGLWLQEHAWVYGFIPALPESVEGEALGHEPWSLRWVGRAMAERLRPPGGADGYAARVTEELRLSQADLDRQRSPDAKPWGEREAAGPIRQTPPETARPDGALSKSERPSTQARR